jgi:hypothetical protein
VDENLKPWYARSSFSALVLSVVALTLAARRLGWRDTPDEMIYGTVGAALNFLAFLRWSPSDKPPV